MISGLESFFLDLPDIPVKRLYTPDELAAEVSRSYKYIELVLSRYIQREMDSREENFRRLYDLAKTTRPELAVQIKDIYNRYQLGKAPFELIINTCKTNPYLLLASPPGKPSSDPTIIALSDLREKKLPKGEKH